MRRKALFALFLVSVVIVLGLAFGPAWQDLLYRESLVVANPQDLTTAELHRERRWAWLPVPSRKPRTLTEHEQKELRARLELHAPNVLEDPVYQEPTDVQY